MSAYTAASREVARLAHDEARALGHGSVDVTHLLYALASPVGGSARTALRRAGLTVGAASPVGADGMLDEEALALYGVDLGAVRAAVERQFGHGALDRPPRLAMRSGHLPLTGAASRSLRRARAHTRRRHAISTDVGDLLLGVIGGRRSEGRRELAARGVDVGRLRRMLVAGEA